MLSNLFIPFSLYSSIIKIGEQEAQELVQNFFAEQEAKAQAAAAEKGKVAKEAGDPTTPSSSSGMSASPFLDDWKRVSPPLAIWCLMLK